MSNLSKSVGQTPLIKISERIFAKFEGANPSGSIKDRMASYIINDAEKNGLIKKGDTIIEATSGNSGIAFAFLAAERGYKCIIIMPANMSEERKQMLRLYNQCSKLAQSNSWKIIWSSFRKLPQANIYHI